MLTSDFEYVVNIDKIIVFDRVLYVSKAPFYSQKQKFRALLILIVIIIILFAYAN